MKRLYVTDPSFILIYSDILVVGGKVEHEEKAQDPDRLFQMAP